jgi:diadenosine tetraphosphatase ApaH/serine/threonine PP2A family protein phosphatase
VIYGLLGDIHSNIEALDAVLLRLREAGAEKFLSVGDIVGYGADPSACIRRIREIDATVVAGNHDWAVTGRLDTTFFNVYAREAVEWTREQLSPDELAWLADRPLTAQVDDLITVVHATLDDPARFDYIQTYYDAARTINAMKTPLCVVGHSHVPLAFLLEDSIRLVMNTSLKLGNCERALLNVGSIGQPRDENPKAACGIYDSETGRYQLERVPYDMGTTGEKIRQAGLPGILADRLRFGR